MNDLERLFLQLGKVDYEYIQLSERLENLQLFRDNIISKIKEMENDPNLDNEGGDIVDTRGECSD